MKYHVLGRTGMRVSALCLGTMTFGNEASREASEEILARCLDHGINFVDTANIYADGTSEEWLGEMIQGKRAQLILATKARYPVGAKGPNESGASRRHLRLEVEGSLRRLQTDWIDLFYVHGFDPHTGLEETMRALDDLVREGKILAIGVSNFAAWQVMKAAGLSARHGWCPIQAIQPMYSLLKRQAEVELLPMAESEGIGVMSYSPLGAGVLTGKYLNDGHGRLKERAKYAVRYGAEHFPETVSGFVAIARELGVHPASLAIAWVMAHPAITSPILGARNLAQLEPCLAAMEVEMTDALYQRIAALSPTPPPATDRNEERVNI